tara:strand:+ start:392 stop:655 length:264 start_codon:yes stop_codon:yes gene_type:complete
MHLYFKLHRKPDKLDPSTIEVWDYENVIKHWQADKYYIIMQEDKSAFIPLHWIIEAGVIEEEHEQTEKEKCETCGQEIPESQNSNNI